MTWLNDHLPVRRHPAFRVILFAALISGALFAGIVFLLEAACPKQPPHSIHWMPIRFDDGRVVDCVFFDGAGVTCDWSEAR